MGRQIVTQRDAERMARESAPRALSAGTAVGAGASPREDAYVDRLLKYMPAESVAFYLGVDGVLRSANPASPAWLWGAFATGLIGTWLYLWRLQGVRKVGQLIVSTLAFAVWVFAIGGPFRQLSWYAPFMGSAAVMVFTFIVPLAEPPGKRASA
jgi:hypothetical protein